jgi:hypothetical protein
MGKIFLICKEIQKEPGAKSYMRTDFLLYEKMQEYLVPDEEEAKFPNFLTVYTFSSNITLLMYAELSKGMD